MGGGNIQFPVPFLLIDILFMMQTKLSLVSYDNNLGQVIDLTQLI